MKGRDRPNFIFLLADNADFGDLGCYGSTVHRTPYLDRLAAHGIRFTGFYSTSGVCTPSRASLLTGCYPRRIGLHEDEAGRAVLFPGARKGLNPSELTTLTRRYTEEAIAFLTEHRERPFFLYVPYATPGSSPQALPGSEFAGRSANGPYGDTIEELDWSAGCILEAVDELGLAEDTLIVWASDNGAVGWDPPQGSNAPLSGWGYDTSEGGQRVPCILRAPSRFIATVDSSDTEPAESAGVVCPALAENARCVLGDKDLPGTGERPAGWVADAQFQTLNDE